MPDILDGGKEGFTVWPNEKCASCKRMQNDCPFIAVLMEHHIETYTGITVYKCDLYDPDKDHKLYTETKAEKNFDEYQEQLARLEKLLDA